uniref:Uncharacterized protein LOC104265615 n=1 Tax=Phallusia mammillata TaxID=59560 RepID=A0A6F9DJQ3_9ASCI|nr:uncharacterized protein LOC104265615 [Phallusia mammillata]
MRRDVSISAKQCLSCQRAKIQQHIRAPLAEYPPTSTRFSHLNIDIVGPLPQSQGYTYLLTIVDRVTRWPEAIPMKDQTTMTCARAFISNWIARFGIPADISSNGGAQFTSELWSMMNKLLGIKLHKTRSFDPQANGLVERFHRHLKSALMARMSSPNWLDELPWVLLGIRTIPTEDLQALSAQLVYGAPIRIPGDSAPLKNPSSDLATLLPTLKDTILKPAPVRMSRHGKRMALKKRRARRWWVHPILQRRSDLGGFHCLILELRLERLSEFRTYFRMTPEAFDFNA